MSLETSWALQTGERERDRESAGDILVSKS